MRIIICPVCVAVLDKQRSDLLVRQVSEPDSRRNVEVERDAGRETTRFFEKRDYAALALFRFKGHSVELELSDAVFLRERGEPSGVPFVVFVVIVAVGAEPERKLGVVAHYRPESVRELLRVDIPEPRVLAVESGRPDAPGGLLRGVRGDPLLPAVVELHYVDAELFRALKLFFHETLAERRVAAPVAPCVRHSEEPSGAAEDLRVVPFPQSCEFIGFPDTDSRAVERERFGRDLSRVDTASGECGETAVSRSHREIFSAVVQSRADARRFLHQHEPGFTVGQNEYRTREFCRLSDVYLFLARADIVVVSVRAVDEGDRLCFQVRSGYRNIVYGVLRRELS